MHPLLHWGPFQSSWSLFATIACVLTLPVSLYEARQRVSPRLILELWPVMALACLIGSHVYFLLAYPDYLATDTRRKLFNLFWGMSVQGGVMGAILAAWLMLRLIREPVLPVFDVLSPAAAFAHAVGRLGCLAMGCCWGKPTTLPWGITFTDPFGPGPKGIALHPTQVYEALLCLGLAVFLHFRLRKPQTPAGAVFALYFLGYGLIRFFVHFLRDDDGGRLFLGLANAQYTGLAMILAGAWLLRRLSLGRRTPASSDSA